MKFQPEKMEEEDIAAANILIWMSEAILEEREAIELEKIKMEMKMKVHSSVDGTPLPRFPPIPLLNGKIDLSACSMPFEKQLTATDVREDQNRLSLSKDEVKHSFLPLLNDHERVCQGVPVTTYNPEGKEYEMMFKSWSTERVYVLNGGWKRFFRENGLVERRHWVTVWMFRHSQTRKLCFALTWKFIPMDHPCTIKQIRKFKGG